MFKKLEISHTHTHTPPATFLERLEDPANLVPHSCQATIGESAVAAASFRQNMFSHLWSPQYHPGLPELINKIYFLWKKTFSLKKIHSNACVLDISLA